LAIQLFGFQKSCCFANSDHGSGLIIMENIFAMVGAKSPLIESDVVEEPQHSLLIELMKMLTML
jgi:hypothetical protein